MNQKPETMQESVRIQNSLAQAHPVPQELAEMGMIAAKAPLDILNRWGEVKKQLYLISNGSPQVETLDKITAEAKQLAGNMKATALVASEDKFQFLSDKSVSSYFLANQQK
jgi:hypothetical protein